MKTFAAILVMVTMVFTASAAPKKVLKGNSLTENGKYVVYQMDDKTSSMKTYVIKYENGESVEVKVCKDNKCKNYIVSMKDFEVLYTSVNNQFGLSTADAASKSLGLEVELEKMDRNQYLRQRVISNTPKTVKEYLGLIACYAPMLAS